eukprot:6695702-Prymnesium_polylepis.1
MDLPAGMGPEQASKRGETVLTILRGALYVGEAWFLYRKQYGPTVVGFKSRSPVSPLCIKTNPRKSQPLSGGVFRSTCKSWSKIVRTLFRYDLTKLENCTVPGQDIFKLR